ncbi:glycoside hydrolase family 3 N-terminal domain-containing protein [Mucilaginibacter terrae]|uniref:glycoside hydrolase family 3 N-terminal domain-containing protein n=1 Tax=Mucilaginibacter terrae TaxID=1955052 RepID=UPI003628D1C6
MQIVVPVNLSSALKVTIVVLLFMLCDPLLANDNVPVYLNKNKPVKDRVTDLLKRMTLAEKVAQMCQYVGLEHIKAAEKNISLKQLKNNDAASFYPGLKISDVQQMVKTGMIGSFLHVVTAKEANELQALAQQSRLKIPLLIGIDAIHGNGMVAGNTIYPSPIGMSSTWDTALVKQVSRYTAVEMRATGSHWAFSPNLDVSRDARWGRVGETFGEDPFLVSAFGVATIKGLQGNDFTGSDKVIACAKHLIAGSEPINGLNKAPADLSERTLNEIYLPPFKAATDAGVFSIMPAHNEINGIPCHANGYLMENLLRKQWGFNGFYISDFMDIERLAEVHRIAPSQKEAVYQTVIAGMDMHMHGPDFLEPLLQLIKEGRINEQRIDSSVSRILEAKFKLGLFEDPFVGEYESKIFTKKHTDASLEAAQKSIVLLKNNGILPLNRGLYKKILVTGPNAANQAILGDWSLKQPDNNITTVLSGIRQQAGPTCEVSYFDSGKSILEMNMATVLQAAQKAKEADLVIVVAGDNSLRFEKNRTAGENVDRDDTGLPGLQQQLIEQLQKSGKPVIVVLVNGRPLSIPWIEKNISAIVEAWEPGCLGGKAIADVLFGKVNPSGKLTVSVPRNAGQIRNFYNHKPSQFIREYIDSETGPLYPFGYGLSYTSFSYGSPVINRASITAGEYTEVSLEITNTGKQAGEEIVQLYINGTISSITKPVKELKGFKRISLKPGEKQKVTFSISPDLLTCYKADNTYGIEPGDFKIMTGGSSADKDLKAVKLNVTSPNKQSKL